MTAGRNDSSANADPSPGGSGLSLGIGIAIGLLLLPLPLLGNLREQIVPYLALSTTATLLLYGLHYHLARRRRELSSATILSVAIALRLVLLPMSPSLSDDAWRYLWDGRLLLHGVNPYHYVPADPALAPFADTLLSLQGYPTTNTIYPPGTQLLFAGASAVGELPGAGFEGGYIAWKVLLCAGEMAAVWLLLLLLQRVRLPRRHAILYAWHPLVLVELAGQGHTDGLWVLSLALFLYMTVRGSAAGAAIGIAIGGVTRLFTLLLVPLWWRLFPGRERWGGVMIGLLGALLFLPLAEPRAFESFTTVGVRFTNYYEFNGGFYRLVKWLLDGMHLSPSNAIAGGIGVAIQLLLMTVVWLRAGGGRSDDAGLTPGAEDRKNGVEGEKRSIATPLTAAAGALAIVTAQLLFGTKVHIWYFVAPLFLLCALPGSIFRRGWLWLGVIGPFTYLYYAWTPHAERDVVIALEWGGFAAIVAAELLLKRARRRRTEDAKAA